MAATLSGGGAWRRPRVVGTLLLAVAGTAILLSLMTWQVRRLAWKQGPIATLEERLAAAPVPMTAMPDRATQGFRRVTVTDRFTGATGIHGFANAAFLTTRRRPSPSNRCFTLAEDRTDEWTCYKAPARFPPPATRL